MNELALYFEDEGRGSPALIFLHYFAGSSRSWTHVVASLVNARRCIRLDVPGFGRSPPLAGFSVHQVAQVVAAQVAGLNLESYILVGHSMGGKLAMACAAARPPGLSGLVLVAPSPPTPEPMDDHERRRLLGSHGDRASAESTVHSITRRPLLWEDIATCVEDNLLTTPEAWRWWLEDGSRENIASEVGLINCPVLVLVGSEDPVIPPSVIMTEVLPRIESEKYIEIAGAGHLLPLEAAQEISHAIEAFAEQQ